MTDSKTPDWADVAARALDVMPPEGPQLRSHRIASISQALLSAYERGSNDKHTEIEALLKDPVAVRANYMRGGIACQPLIDEAFERGRKEGIEDAAKVVQAHPATVALPDEDAVRFGMFARQANRSDLSRAIRQLLEGKG